MLNTMGVQEVATASRPELSNIRNVLFGYIHLILKGMTHTSIDIWGKHSYLIPNFLFSVCQFPVGLVGKNFPNVIKLVNQLYFNNKKIFLNMIN